MIPSADRILLLRMQQNERTESMVYQQLAQRVRDSHNAQILHQIGADEARHAALLEELTGEHAPARSLRARLHLFIARIFGLTFGLKRMENNEVTAAAAYHDLQERYPVLKQIANEENTHEQALLRILNDVYLTHMGSIVLGLNDALVELTGALAGFTFALPSSRLVAVTGMITGLSASMSMAASGYLSARAENNPAKPPLKSAAFTGCAYIATVLLLVLPFFLMPARPALAVALAIAILIIAVFNYYLSVATDESFWSRFLTMATLSGGVAVLSFLIGLALQHFIPVA